MNQHVSIPDTEIHTLHAKSIGADFELWIARPQAGFVPFEQTSVQVLYLLDANLYFGTAVEMTRLMHRLYGELPPLLVVGIAYPTDNGFLQGKLRARDFTPSIDAGMEAMARSFPQVPETPDVEPAMGGAGAFLEFFLKEIQPFVKEHYNVQEAHGILFGSSLGGLFVAHTLLNAPDTFDNFIVVSPALWWNSEEIFQSIPDKGLSRDVFIAVGELEEIPEIPQLARFKMVTNARRFASQLSEATDKPSSIHFEEIPGETHTSVIPVALTRALRHLAAKQPTN